MTKEKDYQYTFVDLGIWSGKTSPVRSAVTEAKTSKLSSPKSSASQTQKLPMCLCLTKASGANQDASTMKWESGQLLGEYTTHSFGESPREENASRLSQILEASPHPKYSLSAKACEGILRRAERRGKELPEVLRKALEAQSAFRNEPDAQGGGKGILIQNERTGALSTLINQSVCYGISSYDSNAMKSQNPHSGIYEADTSRTLDLNGVAVVYDGRGNGDDEIVPTITGDHNNRITDYSSVVVEKDPVYCLQGNGIDRADTAGCNGKGWKDGVSYTLNTIDRPAVAFAQQAFGDYKESDVASGLKYRDYKDATDLVTETQPIAIDRAFFNQGQNALYDPHLYEDGVNPPLIARGPNAVCVRYIVRRLTPIECERLQGFPSGWTDIGEWTDSKGKKRKTTDSARYKALGNSIALPFWQYLARRICAQYERDVTMASLFDGIGGFPLVFERCGAKAVWASEIDEFPMAVTKRRFEV